MSSAQAASSTPVADEGHLPVRPSWLTRSDVAKPVAIFGGDTASDAHVAARPAWLAKFNEHDTDASSGVPALPATLADRVGATWQQRLHKFGGKVRRVASWTERGVATWYGTWHKGRRTSSGAVFDPALMTAAHPSLPLGTKVLVTNTATGDSVVVTVNDREPKHPNSIIDLSRGAAQRLGFVSAGHASVRLARIRDGQDPVEVADAPDSVAGVQPAPQGAAMGLPEAN